MSEDKKHCPECEKKGFEIILVQGRRITDGSDTFFCIICNKDFCFDGERKLIDRKKWMKDAEEFNG